MGAARIIIIRHAEKTGVDSDPGLSEHGTLRAAALSTALPRTFGRIDHVIAAQSTEHSVRPLRTVEPLAMALGTRVIQSWKTRDYEQLAESLRLNPEFEQRQVLVCWRHKSLQNLALALGATDVEPWPETEYDRTWILEYSTPGPAIQELRQELNGKELKFHGQIAGPK
jgi:broad specificity phosphatase PhoE